MNIGFILWLYNLARGWDLLEFARIRYRLLGLEMSWVPGNDAGDMQRYDLTEIAGQAGLSVGELTEMLEDAHALLSKEQPSYLVVDGVSTG
jgi:predicted aldo/keto reductase-like oxidoreductase